MTIADVRSATRDARRLATALGDRTLTAEHLLTVWVTRSGHRAIPGAEALRGYALARGGPCPTPFFRRRRLATEPVLRRALEDALRTPGGADVAGVLDRCLADGALDECARTLGRTRSDLARDVRADAQ